MISLSAYAQNRAEEDNYQSKELPSLSILSYNIKKVCKENDQCNATRVRDLLQLDDNNYELITDEKDPGLKILLSRTINNWWSIQINQKRCFVINSDQQHVYKLLENAEKMADKKKFTEAIKIIKQVLALKKDMDQAYFLMAYCKLQQSLLDDFIIDAENAISIAPNNPGYLNQMAWFYATSKYSKYRNARKSLQYALKAVSISPDNWVFTDTLAAAYARNGQFHEALATQNKSIQLIRHSQDIPADRVHLYLKKMNHRKEMYQHSKAYTENE